MFVFQGQVVGDGVTWVWHGWGVVSFVVICSFIVVLDADIVGRNGGPLRSTILVLWCCCGMHEAEGLIHGLRAAAVRSSCVVIFACLCLGVLLQARASMEVVVPPRLFVGQKVGSI